MSPLQNEPFIFMDLPEDCKNKVLKKMEVKDLYPLSLTCTTLNTTVKQLIELPAIKNSIFHIHNELMQKSALEFFSFINKMSVPAERISKNIKKFTIEELEGSRETTIQMKEIMQNNTFDEATKKEKIQEIRSGFDQTEIGRSCKEKGEIISAEILIEALNKVMYQLFKTQVSA